MNQKQIYDKSSGLFKPNSDFSSQKQEGSYAHMKDQFNNIIDQIDDDDEERKPRNVVILEVESDQDDPAYMNYTTNPVQQRHHRKTYANPETSLDISHNLQIAAMNSQSNMNLTTMPEEDFFDVQR